MITVENLGLRYGGQVLFQNADLQFTAGNCYGIIGANGAGKSTFLRILSGEVEQSSGEVHIDAKARMSVLKQNQTLYDDHTVLDTVIRGNLEIDNIGIEEDAIYMNDGNITDEPPLTSCAPSELVEEKSYVHEMEGGSGTQSRL